jgi:hypothetical protein
MTVPVEIRPVQKSAYSLVLATLLSLLQSMLALPAAADADDAQIWARFASPEQNLQGSDRSGQSSPAITGSLMQPHENTQPGLLFVPAAPTAVHQRPLELIRQAAPGDFNWNWPTAYGTPGWSLGLGGLSGFGGLSNLPLGTGGLPSLTASGLMRGFGSAGVPYGSFAPGAGGFYPSPYGSAGGFYPATAPACGGNFGCAWRPNTMGQIGQMGRPQFYQVEPTKPAGNYYQPSTLDPAAAGNYYNGTGSAYTPVIQSPPAQQDYWGAGGNPFADAINKPVP